ncbi:MAG: D-glycero-beta-D-manno-heptose 1,7-bisphosphate 7-phosphatase [Burkholderiaceae bacterium]
MNLRPAAFLDRDGVINVDRAYVHTRADFEFIDGVFDGARTLMRMGYALVVITNQSGIGRGWYSENDFLALDDWMRARFAEEGAAIEATYYCPHHPLDAIGLFRRECDCRKPAPGMLLRAGRERGLALMQSVMLGDAISDLQAAKAAGLQIRVLLGTNALALPEEPKISGLATGRFRSLAEAAAAMEANGTLTAIS